MKKNYLLFVFVVMLLVSIGSCRTPSVVDTSTFEQPKKKEEKKEFDEANFSYLIANQEITLKNGKNIQKSVETSYFGMRSRFDINQDGVDDFTVVLTQKFKESHEFFYISVILSDKTGYKKGQAFLLGDRVIPLQTIFRGNEIEVIYLDHKPNESKLKQPTVRKTKRIGFVNNALVDLGIK